MICARTAGSTLFQGPDVSLSQYGDKQRFASSITVCSELANTSAGGPVGRTHCSSFVRFGCR